MRWLFSVLIISFLFVFSARSAHAIVFLPAIVLIPIAKIVALIIGSFSLPALGVGAVWSKLFRKSFRRAISVILIILIILAIMIVIFLKLHNPDRPLF